MRPIRKCSVRLVAKTWESARSRAISGAHGDLFADRPGVHRAQGRDPDWLLIVLYRSWQNALSLGERFCSYQCIW
ncbi:hypothetical protein B0T26DRAFT_695097, partial [Lasiosphaeria miniovina]